MLGLTIAAQKASSRLPTNDRLIDERVDGRRSLPPFGCEVLPVGGGNAGDDQGLEIEVGAPRCGRTTGGNRSGTPPLPSSFTLQSPAC